LNQKSAGVGLIVTNICLGGLASFGLGTFNGGIFVLIKAGIDVLVRTFGVTVGTGMS